MSNNELYATISELKEYRRMADELNEQISLLENRLKEHMTETKEYTIRTPDAKVTWNEVTSTRFDTTAFKKENPDLASRYTKTSVSRRFTIL